MLASAWAASSSRRPFLTTVSPAPRRPARPPGCSTPPSRWSRSGNCILVVFGTANRNTSRPAHPGARHPEAGHRLRPHPPAARLLAAVLARSIATASRSDWSSPCSRPSWRCCTIKAGHRARQQPHSPGRPAHRSLAGRAALPSSRPTCRRRHRQLRCTSRGSSPPSAWTSRWSPPGRTNDSPVTSTRNTSHPSGSRAQGRRAQRLQVLLPQGPRRSPPPPGPRSGRRPPARIPLSVVTSRTPSGGRGAGPRPCAGQRGMAFPAAAPSAKSGSPMPLIRRAVPPQRVANRPIPCASKRPRTSAASSGAASVSSQVLMPTIVARVPTESPDGREPRHEQPRSPTAAEPRRPNPRRSPTHAARPAHAAPSADAARTSPRHPALRGVPSSSRMPEVSTAGYPSRPGSAAASRCRAGGVPGTVVALQLRQPPMPARGPLCGLRGASPARARRRPRPWRCL